MNHIYKNPMIKRLSPFPIEDTSLNNPDVVKPMLKSNINQFLWNHLPDNVTLIEMENLASEIYLSIMKIWEEESEDGNIS